MSRGLARRGLILSRSPLPLACEIKPVVPIRKKPKLQYSRSNNQLPKATAPKAAGVPTLPTIAVSIRPRMGTDKPLIIAGQLRCHILFRVSLSDAFDDDVSEDDVSEDDASEDDVSEDDVSEDDVSEDDVSENDVSEDDVSDELSNDLLD